jgi:hypothetical protein
MSKVTKVLLLEPSDSCTSKVQDLGISGEQDCIMIY